MNNEENNIVEQESIEEQQVQNVPEEIVPKKKKKDKIFILLAVILFAITAGVIIFLSTGDGSGKSSVVQKIFGFDMTSLDKDRKPKEAKPTEEEKTIIEENKGEDKTESNSSDNKKDNSKTNNNSTTKPSGSNNSSSSSSNKPSNNSPSQPSSSSGNADINKTVDNSKVVLHRGYLYSGLDYRGSILRRDLAKMVVLLNGDSTNIKINLPYSDTDKPEFAGFEKYIMAAYNRGYMTGNHGEFLPEKVVSRQVALFVLMVAAEKNNIQINGCKPGEGPYVFSDINEVADGYRAKIKKAGELCIAAGTNGKFEPTAPVKLDHFVTFVNRIYSRETYNKDCTCDDLSSKPNLVTNVSSSKVNKIREATYDHYCRKK